MLEKSDHSDPADAPDANGAKVEVVGQSANRIELKTVSDPATLRQVRKQIESFAISAGVPQAATDDVGLVLNEALANVMRHGYKGAKDGPIVVTAEKDDREFLLSIRDWSEPFDPALLPTEKRGGVLTPGGLGLVCMRMLMNDVQYHQLPDGMLLKLVKRIE